LNLGDSDIPEKPDISYPHQSCVFKPPPDWRLTPCSATNCHHCWRQILAAC